MLGTIKKFSLQMLNKFQGDGPEPFNHGNFMKLKLEKGDGQNKRHAPYASFSNPMVKINIMSILIYSHIIKHHHIKSMHQISHWLITPTFLKKVEYELSQRSL